MPTDTATTTATANCGLIIHENGAAKNPINKPVRVVSPMGSTSLDALLTHRERRPVLNYFHWVILAARPRTAARCTSKNARASSYDIFRTLIDIMSPSGDPDHLRRLRLANNLTKAAASMSVRSLAQRTAVLSHRGNVANWPDSDDRISALNVGSLGTSGRADSSGRV
jgi:hypothetical protein